MGTREQYKRTTDLFVRGMVVVPSEGSPPLWVQKLNAFEQDEARIHASTRRALSVKALREVGSDELVALQRAAEDMDKPALVEGIVQSRYGRHLTEAANAVEVDPTWAENRDILERSGDVSGLEPEEQELISRLNTEYYERVRKGVDERNDQARAELDRCDEAVLRKDFIEAFIERRGNDIFTREHRVAEIGMGVRMCDAAPDDLGSYAEADHTACKHLPLYVAEPVLDEAQQPVLDEDGHPLVVTAYQQVRKLPDELFGIYARTFDTVNVSRAVAKGSASRQSSSASSRPQNEAEVSTPSTPEAVQPAADGT